MPFLTAGDPDLDTTAALLPAIQDAGACICELGIPFSDPVADGPVIQASMNTALNAGVTTDGILDIVRKLRPTLNMGIVAMLSYSILYRKCHPNEDPTTNDQWSFLKCAKAAGFDGFIVPDIPVDEAGPLVQAMKEHELSCSFLISPSTPDDRAERIAKACSGFVYVLSRAGITGEQTELPTDLVDRLNRLRNVTDLPLAVGFGIGNREQVEVVQEAADAVIVGSAIMRRVDANKGAPKQAIVDDAQTFVRELSGQ